MYREVVRPSPLGRRSGLMKQSGQPIVRNDGDWWWQQPEGESCWDCQTVHGSSGEVQKVQRKRTSEYRSST